MMIFPHNFSRNIFILPSYLTICRLSQVEIITERKEYNEREHSSYRTLMTIKKNEPIYDLSSLSLVFLLTRNEGRTMQVACGNYNVGRSLISISLVMRLIGDNNKQKMKDFRFLICGLFFPSVIFLIL
jgi:hypothetical protein